MLNWWLQSKRRSRMRALRAITEILPNIPTGWWTANESYGAYTTAVVGNVSAAWIKHTVKTNPGAPFFAQVAPKAAHEPFAPAPWYIEHWDAAWPAGAPRPPSYNVSADVRADKVAHVRERWAVGGGRWAVVVGVDIDERWPAALPRPANSCRAPLSAPPAPHTWAVGAFTPVNYQKHNRKK